MLSFALPLLTYAIPVLILVAPWAAASIPVAGPVLAKILGWRIRLPVNVLMAAVAFLWLGGQTAAVTAVKDAVSKYVSSAELSATKAQLEEERRRHAAAEGARKKAQAAALEAEQRAAIAQARLEDAIAADTGKDGAVWEEGDIKWLNEN